MAILLNLVKKKLAQNWQIVSQLPIKQNHNDYLKTKIDTAFQFQQVDENHLLNTSRITRLRPG